MYSMSNSFLHDTAQLRTSAAKWLISERGFFAGTMPATTFIAVSCCSVMQFNVAHLARLVASNQNSSARLGKLHPAFSKNACDILPVGGMQQVPLAVSGNTRNSSYNAKMKMFRIRSRQHPTKDRYGTGAKARGHEREDRQREETEGILRGKRNNRIILNTEFFNRVLVEFFERPEECRNRLAAETRLGLTGPCSLPA